MDLWMKIGSAVLIGAMLMYLWPRAKHMLENSPRGSREDWSTFLIVIAVIGLFVLLLINLV